MSNEFNSETSESEIKSCLTVALARENIDNLSVKISGNSEKGDGYVGDIFFVVATGTDTKGVNKEYNLVVKCSKPNTISIFQDACKNEVYLYEKVFPFFKRFQVDIGFVPFDSVPKCYGTYSDEVKNVVVMENLKKIGYEMWNIKEPMTRQHIDLVVQEYGKLHAISVAMKKNEHEHFQELVVGLNNDLFTEVFEICDLPTTYEKTVHEIYELLKDDLEEDILKKWLSFKEQIRSICYDLVPDESELQVIIHGDCWNNNFMFKYKEEEKTVVSDVAILDWQVSKLSSPVLDLSCFLFSCISGDDLNSMDTILKHYYNSFSCHLTRLGGKCSTKYSLEKFLNEWKKYSRYSVMMSMLPIKVSCTSKENLPDISEALENGGTLTKALSFDLTDLRGYKNRMIPIIEHVVNNALID